MTSTVPPTLINPAEALLQNWQLRYRLEPKFLIEQIEVDSGAQVRFEYNRAARGTVAEYAIQLKAGANFPPIVLRDLGNGRGQLVDGNTRRAAFMQEGRLAIPALLVEITSVAQARLLGAALNEQGGVRLDQNEAMEAALLAMEEGYTDAQIERLVGRRASVIRQWRDQQTAADHAKRLDIDLAQVPKTQRRALSKVAQDRPFRELAKLTSTRKLPAADVNALIKDVQQAASEDAAVELIAAAEADYPVSGPDAAATVHNKKAARARMVCPQVVNLAPVEDLFEPAKAAGDYRMWLAVLRTAESAVAYYQTMGVTPGGGDGAER